MPAYTGFTSGFCACVFEHNRAYAYGKLDLAAEVNDKDGSIPITLRKGKPPETCPRNRPLFPRTR
jgi:hypothetical protein